MALNGKPTAGASLNVKENYAADASSAAAIPEEVKAGLSRAYNVGTGGPLLASVQASMRLTFTSGQVRTIDLSAVPSRSGNKTFVGVGVKAILIRHLGDPDGAASVTPSVTGTDNWSNGPFNAAEKAIPSGGQFFKDCPKTGGWAVAANNKILTLTASAHAQTVELALFG